jgi:hypothetical protein
MGNHKLKCSFCGKTSDEVSKLVAGPRILISRIHICNECVLLITRIMDGKSLTVNLIPTKSGSLFARLRAKWHLVLFSRTIHVAAPESAT